MKWRIKGDIGGIAVNLEVEEIVDAKAADNAAGSADTHNAARDELVQCASREGVASALNDLILKGLALLQATSPITSSELIEKLSAFAASDKQVKQVLMQLREHPSVRTAADHKTHQRLYYYHRS